MGGRYETSLNGFYSGPAGSFRQTRVLIAFGRPSEFGRDRRNVTRARVGDTDVPVILEAAHGGAPGNTSYLVIAGDRLYLELYEQASEIERVFTKAAFAEVSAELADVLAHLDEVERTGVLPVAAWYPATTQPAGGFEVADGTQPGIYLLRALVNPRTPGRVHARVFETATGRRLSAARIQKSSTRAVGWTEDGSRGFPYSAEVTVYEGDWSTQYEARFELWHVDEQGHELKLAEATRKINGWER